MLLYNAAPAPSAVPTVTTPDEVACRGGVQQSSVVCKSEAVCGLNMSLLQCFHFTLKNWLNKLSTNFFFFKSRISLNPFHSVWTETVNTQAIHHSGSFASKAKKEVYLHFHHIKIHAGALVTYTTEEPSVSVDSTHSVRQITVKA